MRAWTTATAGVLQRTERPDPIPSADEVLVRVLACGVCRTDLHVIDQELPVRRPGVVPGHQAIGEVIGIGAGVRTMQPGDRVGVAWLRRTCGACRWCRDGRENLCPDSEYTGWDVDGGFADLVTVPEAFAYRVSSLMDPAVLAPLLCAGIIGYRALCRARVPAGGRLGLYGFGSSAHLTAQIARAAGTEIHVMSRGRHNRALAAQMGVASVSDAAGEPPVKLDAAIVFAPAGELVPLALRATERGGTVVLAGIHMTDLPPLDYTRDLFLERDLRTVTANTRADGDAFLRLAERLHLTPQVTRYPFERVGDAVDDLRSGRAMGSLVACG